MIPRRRAKRRIFGAAETFGAAIRNPCGTPHGADRETMPPRPSHLPHNIERTALLKLRASNGVAAEHLRPAGAKTLATMVTKGWIEPKADGGQQALYCITRSGEAALRAKIPTRESNSEGCQS